MGTTRLIGELTPESVLAAAQRSLAAYLAIDQQRFNPEDKKGGYLFLGPRFGEGQFFLHPVGEAIEGRVAKYTHFASVVKPNMLRYDPYVDCSSELQSAAHGLWGGAVAITPEPNDFPLLVKCLGFFDNEEMVIEELVGSFSGLSADGDEGVVVCTFVQLGLMYKAEAVANFKNKKRQTGVNETGLAMLMQLGL